jgi:hypothetical protein
MMALPQEGHYGIKRRKFGDEIRYLKGDRRQQSPKSELC